MSSDELEQLRARVTELERELAEVKSKLYLEPTLRLLDVVVLKRPLPELGIPAGERGTVVELYPPLGIEVEFEKLYTVVTLRVDDVEKPR